MNDRKLKIISLIKSNISVGINDLVELLNKSIAKKVTKVTVIRDLDQLIQEDLVIRVGNGPSVRYQMSECFLFFEPIDPQSYFLTDPDRREIKSEFDFGIFKSLSKIDVFDSAEKKYLLDLNEKYQNNINNLSEEIIKKEFERLMIELSWKSSKIEGNTYDLLETEFLIKENRVAKGHTKLEAQMILNHKDALNYLQKEKMINVSLLKIKKVHNILTSDLGIFDELREKPVGITGTKYKPLEKRDKILTAINELCELINKKENIFEKSILLNLLIGYIQPFNDGNKRTSRLMGNAILMAHGYCPLSFRSIDEYEYKKAMILFYEKNNLRYFKELFIEQYRFAVDNYFNYEK